MKAVSHNQPLTGPSAGRQTHVLMHCAATPEGTGYLRTNALPNMGTANGGFPPMYPQMSVCSRLMFVVANIMWWLGNLSVGRSSGMIMTVIVMFVRNYVFLI